MKALKLLTMLLESIPAGLSNRYVPNGLALEAE
jgi:hypothetical protein